VRWLWPIVAAVGAFWAGRVTGQAALMEELKEAPPALPPEQTVTITDEEQQAIIDMVEKAPGSFSPADQEPPRSAPEAATMRETDTRTTVYKR
jgi:hypothetical protein